MVVPLGASEEHFQHICTCHENGPWCSGNV